MDTLHITLFGQITVVPPNRQAPLKLSRGSQALLAYLLLQQRLVPREVLMDVFWLDHPPERARSSLKTAIWRLRQQMEPSDVRPGTYLIAHTTGEVGFNWESHHWLDIEWFERSIDPLLRKPLLALDAHDVQRIEGALALYRSDLLEGMYEDWALRERERFRILHLTCLTRLMAFHANRNNLEQSIVYGQEILRRDPLREEIHRDLMRLYLSNGQRTLALRQYALCRETLDQELGIPPLEETESLYQQILTSSPADVSIDEQPLSPDIAQLARELQNIKRSLDESTSALARIAQAVWHLTKRNDDV